MSVTAIILTFNEEENLPLALDSLRGWADEVFVVDSYSTDKTVEIALARKADGVRIVQHPFENYSAQWNWALRRLPIRTVWTLKLDADERLTPEFKTEATSKLSRWSDRTEGVYFRRELVFMNLRLRWGGASSSYVQHLWRTGTAVFEDRPVNEHALVRGRTEKLSAAVLHHTSSDLSHWLEKHNRYSTLEAACLLDDDVNGQVRPALLGTPDQRRMWLRRLYRRLPLRPFVYFLARYFVQLGILDGRAGFRYWFLHASYKYWIDLKLIEARGIGSVPGPLWPRRGSPHPVVARSALQASVERPDSQQRVA